MLWIGSETGGVSFAHELGRCVGFIYPSIEPDRWVLSLREGDAYRDRTHGASSSSEARAEFERWYTQEQKVLAGKERENGAVVAPQPTQ